MENSATTDAETIHQIVAAKYSPADLQKEVEKLELPTKKKYITCW